MMYLSDIPFASIEDIAASEAISAYHRSRPFGPPPCQRQSFVDAGVIVLIAASGELLDRFDLIHDECGLYSVQRQQEPKRYTLGYPPLSELSPRKRAEVEAFAELFAFLDGADQREAE